MDAAAIHTGPAHLPGPRASTREWAGLAVLGLASLLVSIDVFVLLLALPSIATGLDASATEQLWIMDIYGFLLVGFMLTAGTLGDRIGRRKLLLIGGAAFATASVIAAFSVSAEMLIAARALLGIAGATLAPSTLGLISTMFRDEKQRGVAIGVWMVCFMGGAAVGPIVGGVMLEYFWWGSVFLLGVPAMALLLILGPTLLPEQRDRTAGRIDLTSVGLSLAAILPIVFGLKELAAHGWNTIPIAMILVGLAFGWLFVRRQRRLEDPLVDFSLFHNRAFATVVVGMMLVTVIGSLMFFTAQYLQLVAGLSPLQAGIAMLPAAIAAMVSFGGSPFIAQRIRPAFTIAGGMAIAAVGCVLYAIPDAFAPSDNPAGLAAVIVGLAVMNLGCGPMVTLGTGIVVGSVPSTKAGAASAMSETSAEFGYALGLATMGSIGTIVYRAGFEPGAGIPADLSAQAQESLAGAINAAAELGTSGDGLIESARDAFMSSVHVAGWITAGIALLIGLLTLVNLRHLRPLGAAQPADGLPVESTLVNDTKESSVSTTRNMHVRPERKTIIMNDEHPTTLVLNGTGKIGHRVVERLTARGLPVRIGSRSGEPRFDWEDRSTWGPVLEGVGSAYVSHLFDAIPGAAETLGSFAELAVESGVPRLVLMSGRGEEEAVRGAQAVRDSGAQLTVLHSTWFAQNFSEDYWQEMVQSDEVALPAGDTPEPFVDADDIADVAVAALTDDRHIGEVYELTGPRLLTFAEAVLEISRAVGREIRYAPISIEEFAAASAEQGVPSEVAEMLTYLFGEVLDGRNAHLTDGVQRALGREPRDFSDYARQTAAAGAWNRSVQAA